MKTRRAQKWSCPILVGNDVSVVHVGGESSRARPIWVEWQKHGSLWRYFQKFEAGQTPAWLKPVLWLGLWSHFLVVAARVAVRMVLDLRR